MQAVYTRGVTAQGSHPRRHNSDLGTHIGSDLHIFVSSIMSTMCHNTVILVSMLRIWIVFNLRTVRIVDGTCRKNPLGKITRNEGGQRHHTGRGCPIFPVPRHLCSSHSCYRSVIIEMALGGCVDLESGVVLRHNKIDDRVGPPRAPRAGSATHPLGECYGNHDRPS